MYAVVYFCASCAHGTRMRYRRSSAPTPGASTEHEVRQGVSAYICTPHIPLLLRTHPPPLTHSASSSHANTPPLLPLVSRTHPHSPSPVSTVGSRSSNTPPHGRRQEARVAPMQKPLPPTPDNVGGWMRGGGWDW